MNILDLIKRRRSSRKFINDPITKDILHSLIDCGIHAPSGYNSQNYRFLLIDSKEEIKKLGAIKRPTKLTANASAWIVVFCDTKAHQGFKEKERSIWEKIWYHNCSAAIQNILLAATYYKLASCWISFVKEMNGTRLISNTTYQELFKDYNIPDEYEPHGIILLAHTNETDKDGYPLGDARHGIHDVKRKPFEEYMI